MAIVSGGFKVTITLTDRQGDDFTMEFDMRSTAYATVITDVATIIAALGNVSSANVKSYFVREKFYDDAFSIPAIGDNSVHARFGIRKTDTEIANRDIPSPLEAIFVAATGANNNVVDVTDANVQAFVNLFKASGVAYISDGETAGTGDAVYGQRVTVGRGVKR